MGHRRAANRKSCRLGDGQSEARALRRGRSIGFSLQMPVAHDAGDTQMRGMLDLAQDVERIERILREVAVGIHDIKQVVFAGGHRRREAPERSRAHVVSADIDDDDALPRVRLRDPASPNTGAMSFTP